MVAEMLELDDSGKALYQHIFSSVCEVSEKMTGDKAQCLAVPVMSTCLALTMLLMAK